MTSVSVSNLLLCFGRSYVFSAVAVFQYFWLGLIFVPTIAIVDELSEPIKYQSAVDKRAAQMLAYGIDEVTFSLLVQVFSHVAAIYN